MAEIGVDMGGTRIKAGRVEGDRIEQLAVRGTPVGSSPGTILDAVADAVRELEAKPGSVGFAIPGEVDPAGKCWGLPNIAGFEGVDIAAELEQRVGCRVVVENDATTAALAECLHGHGRQYQDLLIVMLGTGVGGGLVLGGRVRRGSQGFAAEIGHIAIERSDKEWLDATGQGGTIEAYAGTPALLRRFRELGGEGSEVLHVAESARRGEAAGLASFEQMAHALADGLTNIQNTLDLEAIVFSGGVSRSFDLVEPQLRARLRERAFAPPLGEVPLLVSQLEDAAGVVGAAHLVEHFG